MDRPTPAWLARAQEQREKALRQRPAVDAVERANREREARERHQERQEIATSQRRTAVLARKKRMQGDTPVEDERIRREHLFREEQRRAERELRQRESARIRQIKRNLSKANRKRVRRAELLNRKEGFAALLEKPPAPLIGMQIDAFLKRVPGFGPARVNSLLNWVGVPRHATIRRDSEDMLNVAFELGRWEKAAKEGTKRPNWFWQSIPPEAAGWLKEHQRREQEERQLEEQQIFLRRREQIKTLAERRPETSGGCYLSERDLLEQLGRPEDLASAIDSWELENYPVMYASSARPPEYIRIGWSYIPAEEIAAGLWD